MSRFLAPGDPLISTLCVVCGVQFIVGDQVADPPPYLTRPGWAHPRCLAEAVRAHPAPPRTIPAYVRVDLNDVTPFAPPPQVPCPQCETGELVADGTNTAGNRMFLECRGTCRCTFHVPIGARDGVLVGALHEFGNAIPVARHHIGMLLARVADPDHRRHVEGAADAVKRIHAQLTELTLYRSSLPTALGDARVRAGTHVARTIDALWCVREVNGVPTLHWSNGDGRKPPRWQPMHLVLDDLDKVAKVIPMPTEVVP